MPIRPCQPSSRSEKTCSTSVLRLSARCCNSSRHTSYASVRLRYSRTGGSRRGPNALVGGDTDRSQGCAGSANWHFVAVYRSFQPKWGAYIHGDRAVRPRS
jgi:hypothetical protein